MTVKDIARDVVNHAPEDCSWDQLMDDLRLLQSLEISREQFEKGEFEPIEEFEKEYSEWSKKYTT
jgi:hypothetical protein